MSSVLRILLQSIITVGHILIKFSCIFSRAVTSRYLDVYVTQAKRFGVFRRVEVLLGIQYTLLYNVYYTVYSILYTIQYTIYL